jgi:hypothetical protein
MIPEKTTIFLKKPKETNEIKRKGRLYEFFQMVFGANVLNDINFP